MITKACEEPDKKKPIGRHPILTHQNNISRYTKLCESYQRFSDTLADEDDIEINVDIADINNNINSM